MSSKPKRIALSTYGICLRLLGKGGGRGGGGICEMLGGDVPPGHGNPSYQRSMLIQLILWEYARWALKCFAFASLDQQELFNVT